MEQEKRGLCPYDDKRYLLADLPDGHPNPNLHAYGHRDLAAEEHLVADQPEPGAEMVIRHREKRFVRKHARVTKRLELASVMGIEEKLPDVDADGELNGDQLLAIDKVAAAQPSDAIRMCDVIEQIIENDNPERLVSSPAIMAASPTPPDHMGLTPTRRHSDGASTRSKRIRRPLSDLGGHQRHAFDYMPPTWMSPMVLQSRKYEGKGNAATDTAYSSILRPLLMGTRAVTKQPTTMRMMIWVDLL